MGNSLPSILSLGVTSVPGLICYSNEYLKLNIPSRRKLLDFRAFIIDHDSSLAAFITSILELISELLVLVKQGISTCGRRVRRYFYEWVDESTNVRTQSYDVTALQRAQERTPTNVCLHALPLSQRLINIHCAKDIYRVTQKNVP